MLISIYVFSDKVKIEKCVIVYQLINRILTLLAYGGIFTNESTLLQFRNAWVTTRKDIILVICGSVTSWIIDNIIMSYGDFITALHVRCIFSRFP